MSDSPAQTVAGNIRAEVARRGVSQATLAAALGMTQQAISRRLRGVTPVDVDELAAFADYLGVTPSDLLGKSGAVA